MAFQVSLGDTAVASTAATKIGIRNLNFFYGNFQGLREITLNIPEKQVTAFIGPSGCGKSTLLRTLNRMYSLYPGQRAEGEINLNGVNVLGPKHDLNALRGQVGMVFQKPTPFPMSIYDNIAFGVKLYEKGRVVDRSERQAEPERFVAIGRSAAAFVHCTRYRGEAGSITAR